MREIVGVLEKNKQILHSESDNSPAETKSGNANTTQEEAKSPSIVNPYKAMADHDSTKGGEPAKK